jgi:hypothetical protein
MSDPSTWQDVLDPPFVQRLLRPWQRPGRINPAWSNRIVVRYQQPMTSLPLVDHFVERQYRAATWQSSPLPFVFAQPSPPDPTASPIPDEPIRPSRSGPSQASEQPIVIQAKFMDAARSSGMPVASHGPATSHATVTPLEDSVSPSPAPPSVLPVTTPLPASLSLPSSDRPFVTPARPPSTVAHSPALRLRRAGLRQEATPQFSPDNQSTVAVSPAPEPFAFPASLAIPAVAESSPDSPLPLAMPASVAPALNPSESSMRPSVRVAVVPSVRAPNQLPFRDQPPALPRVAVRSPHPHRDYPAPQPTSSRVAEPLANARKPSLPPSLPLVQTLGRLDLQGQSPSQSIQPLVFSVPTTGPAQPPRLDSWAIPGLAQFEFPSTAPAATTPSRPVPIVKAQANTPVNGPANGAPQQPQVDIDALASKVERKLLRKLVVEQERRGWKP